MAPILGPGRRGRRTPMAEINVTPMVDVMLVLLLIFMVTAPLLATGIQVDLPESKAAALEQNNEPVAITIDARGAVFVDDVAVAADGLGGRLRQIAAASREQGGPRIFLRADRAVPYGELMDVLEILRAGGYSKIKLVALEGVPDAAAVPAAPAKP